MEEQKEGGEEMKEKLMGLLSDVKAKGFWEYGTDRRTGETGGHDMTAEDIADYLLENGVTVQRWISGKDRLPEAGTKALCYLKRGEYWTAVWDDCGDDMWSDGESWCSNVEVTHWMPLPEPPKGE